MRRWVAWAGLPYAPCVPQRLHPLPRDYGRDLPRGLLHSGGRAAATRPGGDDREFRLQKVTVFAVRHSEPPIGRKSGGLAGPAPVVLIQDILPK